VALLESNHVTSHSAIKATDDVNESKASKTRRTISYSFILYATTPNSLYISGSDGHVDFACMKNCIKENKNKMDHHEVIQELPR
jgi:hypothetical protein